MSRPNVEEATPPQREPVARGPRYLIAIFGAIAIGLVPWTAWLFLKLPPRHLAEHWDLAWGGFDVMLAVSFGTVALFLVTRSRWLRTSASVTAGLLLCDAWFDATTAHAGSPFRMATAAGIVEIPLAGICLWLALTPQQGVEPRREKPRPLRLASREEVPPPRSPRVPRLVAAMVAIAGLVTLLSAAESPLRGRVEVFTGVVPLALRTGATSVAALAGFATLLVAGGLARRQRRAWWVALPLLIVAGISHVLKDIDVLDAGLSFGLAFVLIMARHEFDARPSRGSVRRAVLTLPLFAGAAWLFAWIAILFHTRDFVPHATTASGAWAALKGMLGFSLGLHAVGPAGRWIPGLLPMLGVFVVVAAIAAALRPVVEGLRSTPQDHDRVREIVRRYGSDTLAYFALRHDKSYFFDQNTVVAYRYVWNLGLVSGDPVGPEEEAADAVKAFVRYARERGWGIAVLAGSDRLAPVYGSLGLRSFYLGDEGLIDPTTFSLDGRGIRKVRQSCHRLRRSGYQLRFLSDDKVGPDLRDALNTVARSWRGRAPERGFTMALGRLPSPRDSDAMTVLARDPEGRAQGYLHLVPCYGDRPGFSIDQMRRRPETPNGLMEWMVAETALHLGNLGVARLSLNFALLGGLFEKGVKLTPLQRVELGLARRLNPFFQIERLRDFNAKFFPEWVPRYIYYEAPLGFPRVAIAYLEAEAFLRLPVIGIGERPGPLAEDALS